MLQQIYHRRQATPNLIVEEDLREHNWSVRERVSVTTGRRGVVEHNTPVASTTENAFPIHARCPIENGTNASRFHLVVSVSMKRAGRNAVGSTQ
mgnify:CR=1 FL=1